MVWVSRAGGWRRRARAGARHGAEVRLPHGSRHGGRPGDVVGRAQQNLGLGPGLKAGPDILRKVGLVWLQRDEVCPNVRSRAATSVTRSGEAGRSGARRRKRNHQSACAHREPRTRASATERTTANERQRMRLWAVSCKLLRSVGVLRKKSQHRHAEGKPLCFRMLRRLAKWHQQ